VNWSRLARRSRKTLCSRRLLETPYEDRGWRSPITCSANVSPGTSSKDLTPVDAVLVGVHRGGRQKQKAIDQIARVLKNGEQTDELLFVLTVAVRSIRKPEC
jgi:hypothetical protein